MEEFSLEETVEDLHNRMKEVFKNSDDKLFKKEKRNQEIVEELEQEIRMESRENPTDIEWRAAIRYQMVRDIASSEDNPVDKEQENENVTYLEHLDSEDESVDVTQIVNNSCLS